MTSKLFSKLTIKQFYWLSTIFCILGDLSVSAHLYLRFDQFDLFRDRYQQAMLIVGQDPSIIPPQFIREQFLLLMDMLAILLSLLVIMHLCIYLFYFLGKKMARGYVQLLCWFGVPGALLFFIGSVGGSSLLGYYFLPQSLLYLFTLLGVRYFFRKPSETSEPPSGIDQVGPTAE
jgi:hypothetical protein